MAYRLTKHHGLGNDFLVLLGSSADTSDVDAATARRWCDRRRGIGADGLLVGTDGEGAAGSTVDLVMTLFNADGSRAEMSGNGIRCLAQAEARRRGVETVELRIATDGGIRSVAVEPDPAAVDQATVSATVDMGSAAAGPEPDIELTHDPADLGTAEALALSPRAQVTVDLGNPHLVLLVDDPEAVDLVAAGSLHEAAFSHGINVHAVAPTAGQRDALTVRVWERGVGVTDACGTGAAAAAHAAHEWGLVGRQVTVHMPGGDVEVTVDDPIMLTGPATFVATVEL
ncbi:MAG: diaminopimelate epimerase, partial [Acidimicrobiales bacterium]